MKFATLLLVLALAACSENAEPPLPVSHGPWAPFVPSPADNYLVVPPQGATP